MTTFVPKTTALFALVLLLCCSAVAQSGPTANVSSVNFTYTANSSTPPKTANTNPFTVTLPAALNTQTMVVTSASNPQGWLSVTPAAGRSPLVLTVTVNPTTLDPGYHSGTITVDTAVPSGNPAVVLVTIAIASAPPTLKVAAPSSTTTGSLSLAYTYVTGSATPTALEVDVASSGDVIPFSVTASNAASGSGSTKTPVWLRVNQTGLPPNLTTSGVALSGSVTQIFVTIDPTVLATLDPISSPFNGLITISPTSTGSATTAIPSVVVAVSLQVSPGPPSLRSPVPIFPNNIPASPTINPVITIYGDNFFGTTGVTIQQPSNLPIPITGKNLVWIGRTVMQVTVLSTFLTAPATWTLSVQNANQAAVTTTFQVTDPALPIITSVVSAASYLPTAVQSSGINPVPVAGTSVSPREIISIFGRNLGPTTTTPLSPSGSPAIYPPSFGPIVVEFAVAGGGAAYPAPLIMVSGSQINCVVPKEVDGSAGPMVVRVYNTAITPDFPISVVAQDPGVFTFGGVGQGQAAILNFDSSTGSFTVNSAKSQAARNSAISIFVTGVGDLDPLALLINGAVAPSGPISLMVDPTTVHVDIDGQPAVVTYAGTSPGAVAGLVQINAIVPLAAKVSATDSLTVSIGNAASSRRSQPGVTMGVK